MAKDRNDSERLHVFKYNKILKEMEKMNFEKFEQQIAAADNDSLIRSLVEHAKKMDTDVNFYEAVKLIKKELLERLEGDDLDSPQKKWREELTENELMEVLELYRNGMSISKIQKHLGDEKLSQKAIRLAIANEYGESKKCTHCDEITTHIAHEINGAISCVNCGKISRKFLRFCGTI